MKRILVIEDSIETQDLLIKFLSSLYEVAVAETGEEGLKIIAQKKPDFIILDLNLPGGLDGYEICHQLKEKTQTKNIPILILSAKSGASAHTMAYKLGADNYLEKPFNRLELMAIIEGKFKLDNQAATRRIGNFEIDPGGLSLSIEGEKVELTSKEFKTLSYLFDHFNQIIAREDVLKFVWGDKEVTQRVVDNHITGLRKKIKKADIKIESVYGKGYKLTNYKN